jgi:hypothetical protein
VGQNAPVSFNPRRTSLVGVTALGVLTLLLAACGGGSSTASSPQSHQSAKKLAPKKPLAASVKPTRIYAGPSGLTAIGPPQPNGTMWLLARTLTAANIRPLDLATGKATGIVPVSATADALTELSTATVVVGTGTVTTGSIELRNGTSGALETVIPVSDPVKSLAPGANGTTVYALEGTPATEAVAVIDTNTDKVTSTVPVSSNTIAISASVDGTELYGVQSDGMIRQYAVAGGKALAQFKVGTSATQVAVSPDGSTLYVLKGAGRGFNVAVVNVATERDVKAVPAPSNSIGLTMTPDGSTLYVGVGPSKIGNIQAYSISNGG